MGMTIFRTVANIFTACSSAILAAEVWSSVDKRAGAIAQTLICYSMPIISH
jgi:hypothetical protein